MKHAVLVARLIFGAWYVMSGLRYWQPDMPMGHKPIAVELLTSLVRTDIMLIVKLIEVGAGLALLANLFVPLVLAVSFPVTLMVAYVCLVIEWPLMRPLIGGGATLALHVFLLFAYLEYYRPMFARKARTA